MKPQRLFLLFILVLPLLLAVASPAAAQAVTGTTRDNARLRSDPNTSASILVTVPFGSTVNVNSVNAARSWYNVTYNGITGWMSATVLNIYGNAATLPVIGGGGGGGAVQPQLTGVVIVSSNNLNMRSGAGTNFPRVVVIPAGTQVQAVGVNGDRTWVQVNFNGQQGWVAAYLVRVVNGSLDSLGQGGGSPGGGNAGGGGTASISFTANRTSINAGECVTIRWDVENINQVFYQGAGVTGHESRTECPAGNTTYVLRVTLRDGSSVERTITINVGGGGGARLDFNLGSINLALNAGFPNDPRPTSITNGGGPVNAYAQLGGNCYGYYSAAPTLRVNYTAESMGLLRFYFVRTNSADPTMVVNGAHGAWHCNDDSWGGRNPTVDINSPPSGDYDIWIGTLSPNQLAVGTLYVTERPNSHP